LVALTGPPSPWTTEGTAQPFIVIATTVERVPTTATLGRTTGEAKRVTSPTPM
jgi:hypothetical protein